MNIAVILAGGTGSRTGCEIPKQYLEAWGRPMIAFCMETFFTHEDVDAVQIVAEGTWKELILRQITHLEEKAVREQAAGGKAVGEKTAGEKAAGGKAVGGNPAGEQAAGEKAVGGNPAGKRTVAGRFRGFSMPGANRQMSILNALSNIREYAAEGDTVMIHDAARPFVTSAQISACLRAMEGHDGVIPVLPMKDTVYMGDGKRICSLLERERIYAGQAPELFLFGKYYAANMALLPERILSVNGSTEPAVLAGMDIVMVEGDENNFKVTTAGDVKRFRERCEGNEDFLSLQKAQTKKI